MKMSGQLTVTVPVFLNSFNNFFLMYLLSKISAENCAGEIVVRENIIL